MKISALIKELQQTKAKHGDIEVTCTGTTLGDQDKPIPDVFETTVENLVIRKDGELGLRVRLYL
jgi:hypothetical protein